jgi:anti-sigma B factor antagonist
VTLTWRNGFTTSKKSGRPEFWLLSGTPKIVVNLNGVDYIDSGGFGILVGLFISAQKRGGELKLVSPNRRVKEVLRHTNLDTIFRVYGNNDDAVAAFRREVA